MSDPSNRRRKGNSKKYTTSELSMYIPSNIPSTWADKQRILCLKIHPKSWI